MQDKEVGELWQSLYDKSWGMAWFTEELRDCVASLIHKLVEERNCRRIGCQSFTSHTHPFGNRPIDDFGIPEEGWK